LEDPNPECRYHTRQAFLTFYEIWPEESEALILEHKSTFMKHKEIISKLGSALEGDGEYTFENNGRRDPERKTVKTIKTRDYLSPVGVPGRRGEAAPKSQNRTEYKTKFMSEERKKTTISKPTKPQNIAMSSGFKNYKRVGYDNKELESNTYVSKFQSKGRFNNRRSISKDVIDTYKSSNIGSVYNNGRFEDKQKVRSEADFI